MRPALTLVVVAACAIHSPNDTCQWRAQDGTCCDGRGCASGVGPLTVTVLDAVTQQPVAGTITFTSTLYMGPIPATCSSSASPCPSWQIDGAQAFGAGAHDITATATGYRAATFTVVLMGPTGCCGQGPPVSATVTLAM
jgi:hypothetical protein